MTDHHQSEKNFLEDQESDNIHDNDHDDFLGETHDLSQDYDEEENSISNKESNLVESYVPYYIFYDRRTNRFFFDFSLRHYLLYRSDVFGNNKHAKNSLEKRKIALLTLKNLNKENNISDFELSKLIVEKAKNKDYSFPTVDNVFYLNDINISYYYFRNLFERNLSTKYLRYLSEKKNSFLEKNIVILRKMQFFFRCSYLHKLFYFYTNYYNNIPVHDFDDLYVAKLLFVQKYSKKSKENQSSKSTRKKNNSTKNIFDQNYVKVNCDLYLRLYKLEHVFENINQVLFSLEEEEKNIFSWLSSVHEYDEKSNRNNDFTWYDFFRSFRAFSRRKYLMKEDAKFFFCYMKNFSSLSAVNNDIIRLIKDSNLKLVYSYPFLNNNYFCYLAKSSMEHDSFFTMMKILNKSVVQDGYLRAKTVKDFYQSIYF